MLASDAARVIQAQVDGMGSLCAQQPVDVKAVMSSFADRIMDPLLQEVPLSVQSSGCQNFRRSVLCHPPF